MQYITIKIQAEDYPFVLEAIQMRSRILVNSISAQIDAQLNPAVQQPAKKVIAPHGFKKDGTPKKRPGRPAK
jgi:hypothetical protein